MWNEANVILIEKLRCTQATLDERICFFTVIHRHRNHGTDEQEKEKGFQILL